MSGTSSRSLYVLVFLIILCSIFSSSVGLFYSTGGTPFDFINQYGDTVKIYGDGLYAHDSFFMAPILRGTDFSILFFAVPLLLIAWILDIRKNSYGNRLFLISVISTFLYYSLNLVFGVTYNSLHLVYIANFSVSLFGLMMAVVSINRFQIGEKRGKPLPYKGIYVFLLLSGAALILAWIPDIVISLISGRSLALIEIYTTSVTNVLDIGIIGPAAFICLFQLKKQKAMGSVVLAMILTTCTIIGLIVPVQTVFQLLAGIEMTLPVLLTKVSTFVLLALFALYFNIRLYKSFE